MTTSESVNQFEERHYTIGELAEMWKFSTEFVRQIVQGEPGVTEWVRQQPGRRRYRVIRVPKSVAERLYRRALARADQQASIPRYHGRRFRAASGPLSSGGGAVTFVDPNGSRPNGMSMQGAGLSEQKKHGGPGAGVRLALSSARQSCQKTM